VLVGGNQWLLVDQYLLMEQYWPVDRVLVDGDSTCR
jgi:hypothetical protein